MHPRPGIVFVESFFGKCVNQIRQSNRISHLSGVHPSATRLLAKLRRSMSWPHLFLPISLPPHAPSLPPMPRCGKNDVAVISGGIATTTASFLRTGHPHHHVEDWTGLQEEFRCEVVWGSRRGSLKDDLALFHREPWPAARLRRKRRRALSDGSYSTIMNLVESGIM